MTAVIAFTAKARNTGTKLKNVDRLVFYKYAEKGDIPFKNVAELREKIVEYSKLVFICACGIAVRTIAPFVKNKKEDFAVVVCDEDGKFAISLLSGHLGGANELAENVAEILGGQAVITTATDVNGITAIDNYAKENGLEIDSMKMAKEVSAQLLNGEKVTFHTSYGENIHFYYVKSDFNIEVPKDFVLTTEKTGVYVTYKTTEPFENTLKLYKKSLVVGIGCKKGTPVENVESFLKAVFEENSLSERAILKIGTIDIKKNEKAIVELSKKYNVKLEIFDKKTLNSQKGEFSHSDFVLRTVGTDCVCERAVVAGGGKLIVKKQSCNGVTIAVGVENEN